MSLNQEFTNREEEWAVQREAPGAQWPPLTAGLGGREVTWTGTVDVAALPGHPLMHSRCKVPVVARHQEVQLLAGLLDGDRLHLITRGGAPVVTTDWVGCWTTWGTPGEALAALEK